MTENSSAGVTNYSYGGANKRMSSAGVKSFAFSYDNNGNAIAENSKQYIYNQNQRLIKAVENGNTLGEYTYNANGQRVKKVAKGRTTYFIYDQSGNLIEEADESGQVNIDYIYLGSVPIARVDEWWEGMKLPDAPTGITLIPGDRQLTVSWNPADTHTDTSAVVVDGYRVYWGTEAGKYTSSADVGKGTNHTITGLTNGVTYYVSVTAYADIEETYFYHTDHLGTPILMTDKNQQVVWSGEFLPFGEEYSITRTVTNNLRFPGQFADAETGLNQNWNRDYHSLTGTYRQRDPIGFAGGMNLYSYGNNPVNLIDPLGLFKIKICLNSKKLTLVDDNGKELMNANIIKGCKDSPTPTGKFTLGDWQKDKTSKRWGDSSSTPWSESWWGGNVFGPYFVPVIGTRGVGIHGHRGPKLPGSFTAASLVSPCSHGCVRLSNYDIETMYDLMPKPAGTQVEIIANCE